MSVERRKVLELLAAGKITAEDAELLLGRLGRGAESAAGETVAGPEPVDGTVGRRPLRYLRVVIDAPDRDSVNIRLPLGLVRTGLKLSSLLPRKVSHRLSERSVDLSKLGGMDDERLLAELAEHPIEIADEDGETVRIFCE